MQDQNFGFLGFIWSADGHKCPKFAPDFIIRGLTSGLLYQIDVGLFSLHFHTGVFLSYNTHQVLL